MNQRTTQAQTQKQIQRMSLVQQRSLSILALSSNDIINTIEKEIEENPALEVYENQDLFALINNNDFYKEKSNSHQEFIQAQTLEESLEEHLLAQLPNTNLAGDEIEIAEILISALDKNGFLKIELSKLFETFDFKEEIIEKVMTAIQYLDPVGTCTRDYTESLLVQANTKPNTPDSVFTLIEHYLQDIAKKNINKIQKETKLSEEEIQEAIEIIQKLNPFPGSQFNNKQTLIIPEAYITTTGESINMSINNNWIPSIGINESYRKIAENNSAEATVTKTLVSDGSNFIDALSQRQQTIEKILTYIIEKQHDFFIKGKKFLKPMTQKELAQAVGFDESTISRAVKEKYVKIDEKMVGLSTFFTASKIGTEDDDLSKIRIIEEIKEFVTKYNGEKKLSAQMVTDSLNKKGIKIARRTVSKYMQEI